MSPFAGIAVGRARCAVAARSASSPLLRPLSGGYFAVATWWSPTCFFLYVTNAVAGRRDRRQPGRAAVGTAAGGPQAYTYWPALAADGRSSWPGSTCSSAAGSGWTAAAVQTSPWPRRRWASRCSGRVGWPTSSRRAVRGGRHMLIVSTPLHRPRHGLQRQLQRRHAVHGGDRRASARSRARSSARWSCSPCRRWFSPYGPWYLVGDRRLAVSVVPAAPGGLWRIAARRGWSLIPVGAVYDVPAPRRLAGGGPVRTARGGARRLTGRNGIRRCWRRCARPG